MNFDMVLKQFKLDMLILLFLLIVSQKLKFGIHSDIYELIWFKLDMMIDIAELILILLKWPWPSFKITGVWEN